MEPGHLQSNSIPPLHIPTPCLAGCSSGPTSYTVLVWELCSFSNQDYGHDVSSHAIGIGP